MQIIFKHSYFTIDGTLTSTTTLGQSGPGSNSNEEYSTFHKAAGLEPHYQMQFRVIPLFSGSLTSLQGIQSAYTKY